MAGPTADAAPGSVGRPGTAGGPGAGTAGGRRRSRDGGDSPLLVVSAVGGGLVLHGRVDGVALPDLRAALSTAVLDGVGELVVDVTAVTLVEAAGLGVLLEAHRRCHRAGRRLVLTGVGADLARLLFVTRLSRVLDVRGAEPAAVGAPPAEDPPGLPLPPAPAPRTPSS